MLVPTIRNYYDPVFRLWRQKRVRGQEYDDFVDKFVQAIKRRFRMFYCLLRPTNAQIT